MKPRTKKLISSVLLFTCGVVLVSIGCVNLSSNQSPVQVLSDATSALFTRRPAQLDERRLSGGAESLFGSMESIHGELLMISLLIVVGGILCLESLFHALHHFTLDTPFNDVVIAIEKELMVVGCTAFALKIIINTQTTLSHEVFFALEFSDLLVPIFSFANCMLSLLLIFMSLRQCELWRKAYHLRLEELLDEFIQESGSYLFMKMYAPFSRIVSEMEFRVFHDIFCESYRIQRKAFAFDEYVSLVYEKFALHIIEIGVMNWMLFLVFMLLSLSGLGKDDHHFKHCGSHDDACEDQRGLMIFLTLGCGMFGLFFIYACLSRYYEIAIIATRGVHSIEDYPIFLQRTESVAQTTVESKRLNEEELKRAVRDAMSHRHHHHSFMHSIMQCFCGVIGSVISFESSMSAKIIPTNGHGHEDGITEDMLKRAIANSLKRGSVLSKNPNQPAPPLPNSAYSELLSSDSSMGILDTPFESPMIHHMRKSMAAPDTCESPEEAHVAAVVSPPQVRQPANNTETIYEEKDDVEAQQQEGVGQQPAHDSVKEPLFEDSGKGNVDDRARDAFNAYVHNEVHHHEDEEEKPNLKLVGLQSGQRSMLGSYVENVFHRRHTGSLQEVFFFGKPALYFEAVKLLPLPLSLYVALWAIQFVAAHGEGLYKFLSFLPALFSIICFMYTVKCAAMLKAVYHVDKDAVLEVLEQTEGSRLLGETIREKLLSKLDLMGDPYTELRDLFQSIDHDHSNRLSRAEFEILMEKLDINFSKRKWKQIYHEIDRNYDDEVTFEEFFFFLFPNHDVSVALERKRMKIIKKRVAAKARTSNANIQKRRSTYSPASAAASDIEAAAGPPSP